MRIADFTRSHPSLDRLDLELLTADVIRKDRSFILSHPEYELTESQSKKLSELLRRRKAHEPLAYLTGEKEFYGLSFFVNQHTLIPRPETEILVEQALERIAKNELQRMKEKVVVVDIGTGSGCIIISLVKRLHESNNKFQISNFKFFATDISSTALRVARKNAHLHQVKEYISFIQGDLLTPLTKKLSGFDEVYLLANLPYLSSTLYRESHPDVKMFEPKSALVSGPDGLDHYRQLAAQAQRLSTGRSHIFLEISPEQADKLDFFPGTSSLVPDLSGRPRVFAATFSR